MLKKSFHHILFEFVLLTHLLFHFSNSSSNFRTVSLLLSHWLSVTSLTSLQLVSISSSVLIIKAAIALSSSSSFHSLVLGLLVRRCHLFDCVPVFVRKFFFFCHSLSLSLWKGQGLLQELLQKLMSLAVDVSNDCFQFTEKCSFCKNVGARVKCSQYCYCCDGSKVNTIEGWRSSTCHSEGTPRQRRRRAVVPRLTWVFISVTFTVS